MVHFSIFRDVLFFFYTTSMKTVVAPITGFTILQVRLWGALMISPLTENYKLINTCLTVKLALLCCRTMWLIILLTSSACLLRYMDLWMHQRCWWVTNYLRLWLSGTLFLHNITAVFLMILFMQRLTFK